VKAQLKSEIGTDRLKTEKEGNFKFANFFCSLSGSIFGKKRKGKRD
jgi:hypothetical protein